MLNTRPASHEQGVRQAAEQRARHGMARGGESLGKSLEGLHSAAPQVYHLLLESETLDSARHKLYAHLYRQWAPPPGACCSARVPAGAEECELSSKRGAGRL
jgi:hypothetical protein